MLSLVLVAMLGVIPTAEEAAAPAGSIEITQANVEFGNSVYLLVAVDYTDAYASLDEAKANITISIDGKVLTPDDSVAAPEGTVGFKYTDLGAQYMGDVLEIKAFDGETEADSTTYSILEYTLKAKDVYSDDSYLMAVVDAMIDFGAEAQSVFEYTGDYDLSKEHGMVLVGGSAQGKYIAEVGAEVIPTADTSVFVKSDVKLYNLTFDVVANNAITVADGISRYFFYGSDLWGAEGSYDSSNGDTKSPNAGCNLDLDLYSGSHNKLLVSARVGVNNGYKYSLRLDRYLETGVIEALTISGVNYGASSATSQRPWRLESASTENTAAYKDGYREIDKGWLHLCAIDDPATADTVAPSMNLAAAQTTVAKNFLVDGKFTATLSIAKKAGEVYTENPFVLFTTNISIELCHVEGNTVKIGDTVITNLREFTTDTPAATDFTVFHFVVDENEGTVTVYTDDGACVKVDAVIDGEGTVSNVVSKGGYLRWAVVDGAIWLNRCAMSEGDLFN